jgi:acyl dehydratase
VYAYLTRPLVEAWGEAWLERGTMEVRFRAPFYDGDEVLIEAHPSSRADAVELLATNGEGQLCATADARLPQEQEDARLPQEQEEVHATDVHLGDWPVGPLPEPDQRRPATRDGLQGAPLLGTLGATFRTDGGAAYVESVGDDLAVYRGQGAVAHPGWLLSLANYVLASNVALGPWVHTASEVRHHGLVTDGDRISVRARVLELSEARGHELVHLDVAMVVGDRAVARVRHSAIYRLRATAEEGR